MISADTEFEGVPRRAGVTIAGASTYNLKNVSDDSMFEPLYRTLRKRLGDEPISLLCRFFFY